MRIKKDLKNLILVLVALFSSVGVALSKEPCVGCGKIEHYEFAGVGDRACHCSCGGPIHPNEFWTQADPVTCQSMNGEICWEGGVHGDVRWSCQANTMVRTVTEACMLALSSMRTNLWKKECPTTECTYRVDEMEFPGLCEKDRGDTISPPVRTAITCSYSGEIECLCNPK